LEKLSETIKNSLLKHYKSIENSRTSKNNEKTFKFNKYFEIHPVIKQLPFLFNPVMLLDADGDKFDFEPDDNLKRGGYKYIRAVGWVRYGLNIKKVYKDISKWLGKDGNPDEW
jgi:hypothetical protein